MADRMYQLEFDLDSKSWLSLYLVSYNVLAYSMCELYLSM